MSGGGKALALLVGILAVFALTFILIFGAGVTWRLSQGEGVRIPGGSGDDSEAVRTQEATRAQERTSSRVEAGLEIIRAEWSGDRVVVEGEWEGELSSVSCDLFEGEDSEDLGLVEWWDRTVPVEYDTPNRTFTQTFVAGDGEAIDPEAEYRVICTAIYPDFLMTSDEAPVEGSPPAG